MPDQFQKTNTRGTTKILIIGRWRCAQEVFGRVRSVSNGIRVEDAVFARYMNILHYLCGGRDATI